MRPGKRVSHLITVLICLSMILQTPGMARSAAPAAVAARPAAALEIRQAAPAPAMNSLDQPLTIARTQEQAQPGGPVTITYTLYNNLLPTRAPQLTDNVTDTVASLVGFDPAADVNSLRGISLATDLAPGVSLVGSTFPPAQEGSTLTWSLAALPPGSSQMITLTVQPPASAGDFLSLESGLSAEATLWDAAVSAAARPVQLAPASAPAGSLAPAPEVDPLDDDMLWFSAKFTQDPLAAFDAVKAMGYEPYRGSLRGTRGTLWSGAGNSLDQASLLIAMLRAAGIPARYKQGTLNEADARTLLASAFPGAGPSAGYVPAGADVADPLNDPALIAIAQEHWWVEALLPGQGWTQLDPSFPGAAMGQSFASPGPHDGVTAVPTQFQHTLTLALAVEQYSAFPVGGSFVSEIESPLFGTFPTAQVAGKRVSFGQFVDDSGPGGAIFGVRQIVYQPYFGIEENNDAILGDPFQDLITNFPLASRATVAIWIEYEIRDVDGGVQTFRRPIKDLIGPDVRMNGGAPALAVDNDSPPFLTADEQYVHWVLPNAVPQWAYERRLTAVLPTILEIGQAGQAALDIMPDLGDAYTPEQIEILSRVSGLFLSATREQLALAGLGFAQQTDSLLTQLGQGLKTELFYATPRIFAVGAKLGDDEAISANVDLRTTTATGLVHPGQSVAAGQTAQWLKGVIESQMEGAALEQMGAEVAISAARIFEAMHTQGLAPVLFQPDEIDLLEHYPYSAQGKAYMTQALMAGNRVLAPPRHIEVDGEAHLAWWQIDPVTGETVSVGEDGLHPSSFEWIVIRAMAEELIMQIFELLLNKILGDISGGLLGTPMGPTALAEFIALLTAIGEGLTETFSILAAAIGGSGRMAAQIPLPDLSWVFLPAHLCPVDNCGVEQFPLPGGAAGKIPLPQVAFGYGEAALARSVATGPLTPASLPAGDPAATLSVSPATSTVAPGSPLNLQANLSSNAGGGFTAWAYAPEGWAVAWSGAGALSVTPPVTAAPGSYTLHLAAQSAQNPALIASARHEVTVTSAGVSLAYAPEPNITIPVGDAAFPAASNQTNDGEAEIPNGAFRLTVTNPTAQAQTVNLAVSGAPADWIVLNGARQSSASVTLPPASQRSVGLYVSPTGFAGAGTGFTMNVTMSGGGSGNVAIPWSMAGQAHSYLRLPPTLFVAPDASVDFDLALQNVGNVGGDFPVAAALPGEGWTISAIQPPVNLAPDQESGQSLTLSSPADVLPGQRYRLILDSPAPGSYTQYALADVRIVSPVSGALFDAAAACPVSANLSASLEALALAAVEMEYWCGVGDCPPSLQDRVVAAGQSVASYARVATLPVSLPGLPYVQNAVAALADAQGNEAILAGLAGLADPITRLSGNLCDVANHRATARFTPYVEAILLGGSGEFSLDVTNQGVLTTTYAITVTGLPGAPLTFSQSIPAGGSVSLPVNASPGDLGIYDLAATITPQVADLSVDLAWLARARLNVVDRFVQVTEVSASPDFVDTGSSSTQLRAEVANLAGVAQAVEARAAILSPQGATVFSDTLPLTLLAGNPRSYGLGTVNTSGWAAGIYTVTVDLRDGGGDPVADGTGFGYFSVGQSLRVAQSVTPEFVAPGMVTVSSRITTEIVGGLASPNRAGASGRTIYDMPAWATNQPAPRAQVQPQEQPGEITVAGRGPVDTPPAPVDIDPRLAEEESHPLTPFYAEEATEEAADEEAPESPAVQSRTGDVQGRAVATAPAFTRVEQDDPAWSYTGTWTNVNLGRASGGSHWRNATAGSTAEISFTGTWISLGFIADRFSGQVAVAMDGNDYGVLDLYRNQEGAVSYLFEGLAPGAHTLTLTVQGAANPFASNTRVQLDYVDYGDGSLLPDGDFEQNDPRLIKSSGWFTTTFAGASGDSYIRSSNGTAWFPFAGDSFTLQTFSYANAGKARLFVDGVYLDTIDMFAPVFSSSGFTRTFSYDGFGSGPHILQVMTYQGETTIDKLTTPGTGPFIDPNPPVTGVTRFEADHPSIRYNGVPFTQTASSWVRVADINANRASAGEYIYSPTAGDTVSFDFDGDWLGIGFATTWVGGQAEIAIDGQLMETVDLYSRYNDTASFYFRNLGAGPHTVTITVLGTRHPEATGTRVHLDFFDVWDGQPLAEGTFEEDSHRVILSNGWGRTLNAEASGGAFSSSTQNVTAWFPFTGDSFTYDARTRVNYQDVELRLNGETLGQFDLYSYEDGSRAYSFDNLGTGPHVLEIRQYRGPITVDAVSSPAIGPAYEPPAPPVIVRYEEDHPDMRYNGQPYPTMPQSWALDGTPGWTSSGGNSVNTSTAGNVWSFGFEGEWVNVGMRSTNGGAEIRINGVSQGIFNMADGVNGVKNFPFALDAGSHLVEVEVISGTVAVDYMDVWQGEGIDDGWYDAQLENEESGLFHFSQKQWWRQMADIYAYNGDFLTPFASSNTNIWFTFVGTDLTILGNQLNGTRLHVVIDGVDYGEFDMATPAPFRGQPFSLHFPDLGEGAHVAQVFLPSSGLTTSRIDAFEVNPDGFYSYMPEIKWYDMTATEELTTTNGTGFLSSIAIGDLNGDGSVELVAPGLNGRLYVYRGDGADAGDGTPILWTSDLVGPAAEPALADLTGDGNAEIVISGENGTFAFTHDGNVLWHNPDVVSFYTNERLGWGGPSIANLDLSPEPEIVIAASRDGLYVLDHMGNTQWSVPLADRFVTPPVLADITGDGMLDIIVADQWDLRVYDYFNGGQLVWEYTQPDQVAVLGGAGAFGPPAVADITGDGQPEIIINWGVFVEALRADGTLLWKYNTGNNAHFRPSPITVADTTGDGQMNLVTASAIGGLGILNHTLMVLDADGNLVWEQLVRDTTASASGVSAQDLTGNGVWEVLWNGSVDGFLVLRGSDGKRLFNEPYTASGTVLDYPTLGDVDGDGVADVVMAGRNGLFVISHVGRWIDSRPIWNQHNYHVSNINDDWSVPISAPNSWELHNTYRTQTPDRTPAPSYGLSLTYTVGGPDVTLLAETAVLTLTGEAPTYAWSYRQEWYEPVITNSFDSQVSGLQPGEVRQISAGTEVRYRLPSGLNVLSLPPLYVTAAGLGELNPAAQRAVLGGSTSFTLTLTNPGASADTYSVAVSGIPDEWLSYPASVNLAAGQSVDVTIGINVPMERGLGGLSGSGRIQAESSQSISQNPPNLRHPRSMEDETLPLLVDVSNGSGGSQSLQAELTLFDGLGLSLSPAEQTVQPGGSATFTLTLTNREDTARTYALSATGLPGVDLPADPTVGPGETVTRTLTVTADGTGPQPFTVAAAASSGAAASGDGLLNVPAAAQAAIALSPDPLVTGPGSVGIFTLLFTNRGEETETFTLAVDLPGGWSYELRNGQGPVSSVTLPPAVFNSAQMALWITPNPGTAADSYAVTVRAVAQSSGQTAATATGTVEVINRGVQISLSGPGSISAQSGGVWNVQVTNTGSVADSFRLGRGGLAALAGSFSAATVSLAPGASQTVQLTLGNLGPIMGSGYPLSVSAVSEADERIQSQAAASVDVGGFQAVAIDWRPAQRTVEGSLTAQFTLLITNTGSLENTFAISIDGGENGNGNGAEGRAEISQITLPPGSLAQIPVTIRGPRGGVYPFTATVSGAGGASASAPASVTFVVEEEEIPTTEIYLPFVTVQSQPNGSSAPAQNERIYLPAVITGGE